jgi:disulfide bond formation protein DsbB
MVSTLETSLTIRTSNHILINKGQPMQKKPNIALLIAWFIAVFALVFTLYSSEVLNYPVCNLCWYQRICLYPLTLLLGIAAYKNESVVIPYALPLPCIGLLFAIYHYLEQKFPQTFNVIHLCSVGVPCSAQHFKLFGFITFPFLSILACVALITLLIIAKKHQAETKD